MYIIPAYLSHLDNLSTAETQLLIVIQDCVHALNPKGVNWTIEHEPLLIWCVVGHSLTNEAGYDAISPAAMEPW